MKTFRSMVLFALVFAAPALSAGDEWETLIDLRGEWKFQPGDDSSWSNPVLNDKHWDDIFVPSPWEDEGYPGYDGYAWYRKHFRAVPRIQEGGVYLQIGYVDDVCEVYLNGHLIGFSGTFPPYFSTAYNTFQRYPVPSEYFNRTGENVIAIRVYDQQLGGGIVSGKIALVGLAGSLKPDIPLAGIWKLRTGDDMAWKEVNVDENGWKNVLVPTLWDAFGLRDYDGFGWYRIKFNASVTHLNNDLVLLLGKIDDLDEAYLNGERIGRTGRMRPNMQGQNLNNEYQEYRAYPVPKGLLRTGENVLAVRVYDGMYHGGIYEGPVGIMRADRYRKIEREQENRWNFFDWFK